MGKILDEFGRPYPDQPREPRQARASHYDIARTNPDNARQWEYADAFDSDRANSPAERQTARNRSRHETDNNPSLKGATKTIANYEVGTGPTLHVIAEEPELKEYANDVAARWHEWCEATNFAGRMWSMVYSRVQDGEVFSRLGRNQRLKHPEKIGEYLPVQLDWQPFEADQCHTIFLPYQTPNRIDGIWFDDWGNPTFYDLLRFHPGGVFPFQSWQVDTVPADYVLHLFFQERPKQHRGMPELASSTDLFADRRRFRKATVGAAESAANIGGFLTTDQPADDGYAPAENSITAMPRNSLIVAPNQYDYKQVDPAHPAQTYEMFAAEMLNEATRPACMPLNVAKCDSSGYNFASGRLDISTFWGAVAVNQRNNTYRVVNPLFRAWYAEARVVYETNGRKWRKIDEGKIPARIFLWHGQPYCDPEVEQAADEAAVATGTKGLHEIYARRGKDWDKAKEENAAALGMTVEEYVQWIIGNLGKPKGGDGNQEPKQRAEETPEDFAKRKDMLARQQGRRNAGDNGESADDRSTAGGSTPGKAAEQGPDTPEAVKAKFALMFPALAQRLNGHFSGKSRRLRASASLVSAVPDIRQDTDYRCGAASAMCVGKYFGVGPETLEEWSDELGTTAAQSTSPDAIISYLSRLGLAVNARQGMSVDDLAAETAAGRPVICCCQDYVAQNSDPRDAQAEWDYGHWMTCLAVQTIGDTRFLIFQDSSEENMERLPGGDVPPADEDPETVVEEPGRRFVSEKRWIPAWHDEAVDGVMYDHYGISIGLPETATPTAALLEASVQ